MKKITLAFAILFALSACGGGGGGGSSVSSATNWTATKCTASYTDSNGVKIPCAYQTLNTTQNSTTGSYTSSNYTGYGAFSWTLGSDALYQGTLPSRTISGNYTAPVTHLTDTSAATAWAQGWTGTGTNIYIIDDHTDKDIIIDLGTNTVSNIAVTERPSYYYESIGTYNVSYRNSADVSHGWLVKNIAGGDKRTDGHYSYGYNKGIMFIHK